MAVGVGEHGDGEEKFPETLGRYRLVRRISTGGMAQVFEARRESLAGVAPRVAIKVILPEHAQDMNFQRLFVNEARIGSQLQHPNLVQIQDFEREKERFYLVMEYVEGGERAVEGGRPLARRSHSGVAARARRAASEAHEVMCDEIVQINKNATRSNI